MAKICTSGIQICMNWEALGFDWNQVRAFLATAEEGSFSAAARALELTQPTLGRQVSGLESALGVTLFERTGPRLVLTPTGTELLEHVRVMAAAATRMSLVASGHAQAIEGCVRVTASDLYSAYILPEALVEIQKIAPRLEIEIVASNELQDLLQREADIAIRHVRPHQSALIAQLLREEKAHFYAATSYLDLHGRPRTSSELSDHAFIGFGAVERSLDFLNKIGVHLSSRNFAYRSYNGVAAWEMVRQGLGISVMSDEVAQRTPEVERLLVDVEPIVFPTWLVTHRELHTSRKIRLVYDALVESLARP